jgi:CHAD domain-containing protein/CYTH domain-containing protein
LSLPPDLLQRSPEEASRRIVLELLEAADHAAERLDDPEDSEALHDFRVAIRRTRSTLRAWKPELRESVRGRDRRALRGLQRATGEGRDAQVALEWLASERGGLRPGHRLGHDWLVARLDGRVTEALAHARAGVRDAWREIAADLVPRLEVVTLQKHLRQGARAPTFGETLAERARAQASELVSLLARIRSVEDAEGCHTARVACKRLRYLAEPVREHADGTRNVVKRCKRLQDLLGDLNDAHVQRDELGAAIETAAAERARRLHDLARSADDEGLRREARRSERAGLVELTRRAQARMDALYAKLEEDWFAGGVAALIEDVEELATQLEVAARRDVEIERKYLLTGPVDFSPVAAYVETVEIRQGYLPGDRLRERLRRSEGPGGATYERTVKLGSGVERLEIEEPTTAHVFDTLWPLTEGCRIHKRRHRVRLPQDEGPPVVWEIDEFLDRPLWLAEIELDDADAEPALPEWLAPRVEREVTDDPRYTNLKLAR